MCVWQMVLCRQKTATPTPCTASCLALGAALRASQQLPIDDWMAQAAHHGPHGAGTLTSIFPVRAEVHVVARAVCVVLQTQL